MGTIPVERAGEEEQSAIMDIPLIVAAMAAMRDVLPLAVTVVIRNVITVAATECIKMGHFV